MQGFAFNTRREMFADVRVREALDYLFDFEWINKNLYGGLYARTKSFFDETELASTGVPAGERERALLSQWPGRRARGHSGRQAGRRRPATARAATARARASALALLKQAGWTIDDGMLQRNGRAVRIRDHGAGPQAGTAGAELFAIAAPHRRRRARAHGRSGAISAPPPEVRLRHDDGRVGRLQLRRATSSATAGPRNRRRRKPRSISQAPPRPRSTR